MFATWHRRKVNEIQTLENNFNVTLILVLRETTTTTRRGSSTLGCGRKKEGTSTSSSYAQIIRDMCYANIVRDLSRPENRRYSVLDLKKNQDKEGIKVPVIIPHLNVELISLLSPII